MSGDEMTPAERIRFLELAVEELGLELARLEAGIVGKLRPSQSLEVPGGREYPQDIATILKEQQAALSKMLAETLEEMEKLKREARL